MEFFKLVRYLGLEQRFISIEGLILTVVICQDTQKGQSPQWSSLEQK